MAKIIFENTAKSKFREGFAAKVQVIGLSKQSRSVSDAPLTVSFVNADLTGLKEKHTLQKSGSMSFIVANNLTNPPLLVFTVAEGELPKEYHLYEVDGADYYRNVIIPTSALQNAAAQDLAIQLKALTITFKGDGES